MASTRRLVLFTGIAALSLFALPTAANAAVTCSFTSASGAMVIDVTAGDVTAEVRNNSGNLEVLNDSALQTCSPDAPTAANTDSITMNDTVAGQNSLFLFDLDGGPLGPGKTAEGSGTSEIEVTINASDGLADRLQLIGTSSADTYRFGTLVSGTGANLNHDDDGNDITFNNGERLTAASFAGADTLDASGGTEFSGALPFNNIGSAAVVLRGGTENDIIRAGSGTSLIDGGSDNDSMTGGAGGDEIELGTGGGTDVADGAGGEDSANYQFSPEGALLVDLRVGGPQDTGVGGTDTISNFEDLVGSQQSNGTDTLIGTNGPNRIVANAGNDTLIGRGGDDILEGGLGIDTASYTQGSTGAVIVNLGTLVPQPTVGAGTDTLPDVSPGPPDGFSDIENLIGSPFGGDSLTGDAHANRIDVYDGVADAVDCVASGDGDVASADEIGVDTINANCETTDNAPQTSITSGPANGATVATHTPTYAVGADEAATFQVKVDSGSFQACGATCTVPSLANGLHTLAFRAIDTNENFHADLTPTTRTVSVTVPPPGPPPDTTAPDTFVSGKAKVKTRKKKARVTFTLGATEAGSTFACSLDSGPFAPCSSPFSAKLRRGRHTLTVVATDTAGNGDPTPASFTTKVKRKK